MSGRTFRGLPLTRWPETSDATLRAWDAADELLLDWLEGGAETGPIFPVAPPAFGPADLVVLNDAFGALTLGLIHEGSLDAPGKGGPAPGGQSGEGSPPLRVYSDSVLALEAIRRNGERLGAEPSCWRAHPLDEVAALEPGSVRLALLKIPRSLGALEGTLHALRPALHPQGGLIAAGMTKNVHTSTLTLLESTIGPTTSSHARRKARLVHAALDPALQPPPNPWPLRWTAFGITTVNHAGIFSAERLDAGTGLLLDEMPRLLEGLDPEAADAIDLACGNGILGTWLARARPALRLDFRDASFAAVRSAAATFTETLPEREATFQAADGLSGRPDRSADLVVCNPPFHAQGARGDDTAWRMFSGALRVLRSGGQFWVVGNRHLAYPAKLKRLFGNAEVTSRHPKFVVVRARA